MYSIHNVIEKTSLIDGNAQQKIEKALEKEFNLLSAFVERFGFQYDPADIVLEYGNLELRLEDDLLTIYESGETFHLEVVRNESDEIIGHSTNDAARIISGFMIQTIYGGQVKGLEEAFYTLRDKIVRGEIDGSYLIQDRVESLACEVVAYGTTLVKTRILKIGHDFVKTGATTDEIVEFTEA